MIELSLFIFNVALAFILVNLISAANEPLQLVILEANGLFAIMYIFSSSILIYLSIYSVIYSLVLLCCFLLCAILFSIISKKFKWKEPNVYHSRFDVFVLFLLIIIIVLIRISSQEISSYGDMGAYFQHLLLMLNGNYDSRLYLKEIGQISDIADKNITQNIYGTFLPYSPNKLQLHGVGTWCIFPALFAKMFGLFNNNLGIQYLYISAILNYIYGLKKYKQNINCYFVVFFCLALSPLLLYLGKTNLSEVCLFFLVSGAFFFLDFDGNYFNNTLAGCFLGAIGLIHVNGIIYVPLFFLSFFFLGVAYKRYSSLSLIVNISQSLVFTFSIGYIFKISPAYTTSQYGEITNRLHISISFLFPLICFSFLFAIVVQIIVTKGNLHFITSVVCFSLKHYKTISSIIILAILTSTLYHGYYLAFSDRFKVDPIDYANSTWLIRNSYVNTGLSAVSYLNFINILRATGWIGGIIVIFIPFIETALSDRAKIIYFTTMLLYLLFTTYKWDTPINYYASRYFAPVLVPLIVITDVLCISNTTFLRTIFISSIIFNKIYWPSLSQCATHYGQYQILDDTLHVIEKESVVLFDENDSIAPSELLSDLRIIQDDYCYYLSDIDDVVQTYKNTKKIYIITSQDNSRIIGSFTKIFSNIYISQYSLGHGDNGKYGMVSGEYNIPINIYYYEPKE